MAVLNASPLLLREVAAGDEAYQIEKSLRCNFDDGGKLEYDVPGGGNTRKWTASWWMKRGEFSKDQRIFTKAGGGGGEFFFKMGENNNATYPYKFFIRNNVGGTEYDAYTDMAFRDPTAWQHVVFHYDSANATATERYRIYVNGVKHTFTYTHNDKVVQYGEAGWGSAGSEMRIAGSFGGYLADVHYIDGLNLSPAAFGSFDSTGVWNPKAFALPAPNANTTWSSGTKTNEHASYPVTNAFNGSIDNGWGAADAIWNNAGLATFTPSNKIECNQAIRIYASNPGHDPIDPYWYVTTANADGVETRTKYEATVQTSGGNTKWYDVFTGKGELKKIEISHGTPGALVMVRAIEVDGVILVDGQTDSSTRNNPNNRTKWSDYLTLSTGSWDGGDDPGSAFDGTISTAAENGTAYAEHIFEPPSGIKYKKLEVQSGIGEFQLNSSGSWTSTVNQNQWNTWHESTTEQTLTKFQYKGSSSASGWGAIRGVRIDGQILIDSSVDNSYHLKFNDITKTRYLGKDTLTGKLSAATGGLPIYNTTGSYGDVKGSGYRSDSSAGTTDGTGLIFAWPGDTTTGEVHASINTGSSAKTVTANGDPSVDTTQSRLYGTSVAFDRTGDYLSVDGGTDFNFGNGDYTIECWFMTTDKGQNQGIFVLSDTAGGLATDESSHITAMIDSNGFNIRPGDGTTTAILGAGVKPQNYSWHHLAISRASGTFRAFYDGALLYTKTSVTTSHADQYLAIGGYYSTSYLWKGNIQDFRIYKGTAKYTSAFSPPTRNDHQIVSNFITEAGEVITAAGTIYKTNSTGTKDSPTAYNTDAGASSLVLAIPGDSIASGTTDVHQEINTSSSNKTASNLDPEVSSAQSKFYGNSLYFNSEHMEFADSTDFDFGTGDYTIETWVKPNAHHDMYIFSVASGGGWWGLNFWASNGSNGTIRGGLNTKIEKAYAWQTQWYHVALVRSSGTLKMYLDGTEIDSESDSDTCNCSGTVYIGRDPQGWNLTAQMYINDLRVYKGYAKYTSNFTPPTIGVSTVGADVDSLTDTPTNYGEDTGAGGEVRSNYCIWNAVDNPSALGLAQGNLAVKKGSASGMVLGTLAMPAGNKFYWEVEVPDDSGTAGECYAGIANRWEGGSSLYATDYSMQLKTAGDPYFYTNGNTSQQSIGASSAGDIIGLAFDVDAGTLKYYRNNVLKYTHTSIPTTKSWHPAFNAGTSANVYVYTNFGQRAFKYTAPSGYKCLCTQNLPDTFSGEDEGIVNNPSKYFDIKTYTGDGVDGRDIKGFGFQPDLVWIKARSHTYNHIVHDVIRGANKYLVTDSTSKEGTDDNALDAFLSNGFTVGNDYWVNQADKTYVAWAWDAGTAASGANNDGATNVSAGNQWVNTSAGFSITKYSGGSGSTTVGHGLNAKPDFIIVKCLGPTDSQHWTVYHNSLDTGDYLRLDDDSVAIDYAMFNDGQPTSTVVPLGNDGQTSNSGDDYIMYSWTAIPGYSYFGSYVGNASDDGPFVHCGFKPRWVLVKNITAAGASNSGTNWVIRDTARDDDNPVKNYLLADGTNGGHTYEGSAGKRFIDVLSNGFKVRSGVGSGDHAYTPNINGETFLVAAFAEHPFKTARAR